VPIPKGVMASFILMKVMILYIGVGAETLTIYVQDAARTLVNPSIYIDAILEEGM